MRIVIAGAGEVGTHLAKLLSRGNIDVSLMDDFSKIKNSVAQVRKLLNI